ncbi:MAG: electron transfer flavoprotein subunit alpha/FixB family protein [Chloroflexi bacterium]|nr:electron transfer flavoprotein subunit alpha/FixB family protein [Chloroflexota bacterium]
MANSGIIIFGELGAGRLSSITLELLGAGRKLADALGQELAAIFLGHPVDPVVREAIAFGADKVYTIDNPALQEYLTEPSVAALEAACRQLSPEVLLLGQTAVGRDMAPRLAFRLGTGLAMDCVHLEVQADSRLLVATRPVYGGNALAEMTCPSARPQMATVRAKSQEALPRDDSRTGEVIPLSVSLPSSRSRLVERVRQEAAGVKLEDAEIIIAGGRGIGSAEGFQTLEELARLLSGAVGTTRAAVDANWRPSSDQIGLTGKIVAPTLYVAIAISGASQHLAGCSGSKNIVAINKDPDANIFKAAQYGVVGDYRKVLPAFLNKVKELLETS